MEFSSSLEFENEFGVNTVGSEADCQMTDSVRLLQRVHNGKAGTVNCDMELLQF